jgi:hypothetical protein
VTAPPLPESPALRCRLSGFDASNSSWGTRFYIGYAGAAPSGAQCTAIATQISSLYGVHLAPLVNPGTTMNLVDVIDIASTTGLSGQNETAVPGTRVGGELPAQVAMNVEYGIAQRYRGGKPRGFWPFGCDADLQNVSDWMQTFINEVNAGIEAFFADIEAFVVTGVGPFLHVDLSYYQGFKVVTDSSGRARNVPQYRPEALVRTVTGYFGKTVLGSQKRRRTSTTP